MFRKPKFWLLLAVLAALAFDLVYYVAHPFGISIGIPHISLAAEEITKVGPLKITNTLIASWITMLVLIVLAFLATRRMQLVPRGLQNVVEYAIEMLYKLVEGTVGKARAALVFPTIATLFLFIIISNWMGLLPGYLSITWDVGAGHKVHLLRSANTDLNTTLALAISSVVMSQVYGFAVVGFPHYLLRFFPVQRYIDFFKGLAGRGPRKGVSSLLFGFIDLFIGALELFDEFTKIMSFAFRLFGNIFAGEVLLGVMVFLLPFVASLPFLGLELFVGFVQAFVFAILSTAFIAQATTAHHGEGAEAHEPEAQPAQQQVATSVS